jgi:UDP-N-acetylmuramoyl-tripeptide--D-alanyl-D-alanine ligase
VYALLTLKGQLYIKTHLVGGYNFDNAMAASCVGTHFGIDPLEIQAAIENYRPSNLRSQLIRTESNTLILDAYNANPSSMQVAIENFKEMNGENKIVILGEMLELGQSSEQAHQDLFKRVTHGNFKKIFLIGNHFEHCQNMYNFISWFQDTDALIKELMLNKPEQAFILVKGSRGNQLERIVEYL